MDHTETEQAKIQEVLGSEPMLEEFPQRGFKVLVKHTLPYESYIEGELLQPVGVFSDEDTLFNITDFYVNETMRGNGIGKKLLKAAASYAVDHDAKYIFGHVVNADALQTRRSVFGEENLSFYLVFYYGLERRPRGVTYDEVIKYNVFPITVVCDLTRVDIDSLRS